MGKNWYTLLTVWGVHIILTGSKCCVSYRLSVGVLMLCGQLAVPVTLLGQSDPIDVRHADTWRGTGVDDVSHLVGNVWIVHGETTLKSDYVQYRKKKGQLILDGKVEIERDQTTLFAEHVVYYKKDRHAEASGGVRIVDTEEGITLTGTDGDYFHRAHYAEITGSPRLTRYKEDEEVLITGQRLEYYFADSDTAIRAVVQDSVTVTDMSEQITVTCDRVDYSRVPEQALITGSPRLVKQQAHGEEKIVVTGKRMVYSFAEKHVDVYASVTITRGPLEGVCDTLTYVREEAHLIGRPVLREGNNDIAGDDILLTLKEDSVTQAVVTGRAKATYAPEGGTEVAQKRPAQQKSTLEGRTLTVAFDGETIKEIIASQNARSKYQPSETVSEGPPGHNRISASEITVTLDRGQLIKVSARGGVIGTYTTPAEGSIP